MPSDAQQACSEAEIKFGSLYHQFAGTPLDPAGGTCDVDADSFLISDH